MTCPTTHPGTYAAEQRLRDHAIDTHRLALLDDYDRLGSCSELYAHLAESFLDTALESIRKQDGGIEMAPISDLLDLAAKDLATRQVDAAWPGRP